MTGLPPPRTYLGDRLAQLNDPAAAREATGRAYIPGMGRGATGFTTAPDIGTAHTAIPVKRKSSDLFGPAPAGYVGGRGRGLGAGNQLDGAGRSWEERTGKKTRFDQESEETANVEPQENYDEWSGMSGDTLASAVYDKDDKDADEIWAAVDERMEDKGRKTREQQLKENLKKFRTDRPKIAAQFADLKGELSTLGDEEWASIPEAGDLSRHNRGIREKIRQRYAKDSATPDSLLARAQSQNTTMTTVDAELEAPDVDTGTSTDLTQVGQAREQMLSVQLDKISDSVGGQTVVDPKGYLTSLSGLKITSNAEIGDIKKARLLLKSVTTTNPSHAPGWIAAARLEEVVGKLGQARSLMAQGCRHCPTSEDTWLENARLHPPTQAQAVLGEAVKKCPKSVKIWLRAADLEDTPSKKKRILWRALEVIPNSVRLWNEAVELEEDAENAKLMLSRAVECVPHSVDMWLALARLETYDSAKKVLNRAASELPNDPQIWIYGAMLEESVGHEALVGKIIPRAVDRLKRTVDRATWLKEAEFCEKKDPPAIFTCQAIVRATIDIGVDEADRKATYLEDAENAMRNGSFETARAIYAHALTVFPKKKSLWLRAAHLERQQGRTEALLALLKKAVARDNCPYAEILWLTAAKEMWTQNDVPGARGILSAAFASNPNSEEIWLVAVKLEQSVKEFDRAKALLKNAREKCSTVRMWMKSAMLERETRGKGEVKGENEGRFLEEATMMFREAPKLWMMYGQLEERGGNYQGARAKYMEGIRNCPDCVPLYQCLSRLELRMAPINPVGKARDVLTIRQKLTKSPELWLESIRFEMAQGNASVARQLLANALKEDTCPDSGILWAEAIRMETGNKKTKILDALKKCDQDAYVQLAAGELFHVDKKTRLKARKWYERAVALDPDCGDAWAHLYLLETQILEESPDDNQRQRLDNVVSRFMKADPRHGDAWVKVSKSLDVLRAQLKEKDILVRVAKQIRL